MERLPGVLAEIEEVAGRDAALKIAETRGGTDVYFPARISDEHWLTVLVGREAADKICKHFQCGGGGIGIAIPMGPTHFLARRRADIRARLREGLSNNDIARTVGCDRSTVKKARRRWKDELARNKPHGELK